MATRAIPAIRPLVITSIITPVETSVIATIITPVVTPVVSTIVLIIPETTNLFDAVTPYPWGQISHADSSPGTIVTWRTVPLAMIVQIVGITGKHNIIRSPHRYRKSGRCESDE